MLPKAKSFRKSTEEDLEENLLKVGNKVDR